MFSDGYEPLQMCDANTDIKENMGPNKQWVGRNEESERVQGPKLNLSSAHDHVAIGAWFEIRRTRSDSQMSKIVSRLRHAVFRQEHIGSELEGILQDMQEACWLTDAV